MMRVRIPNGIAIATQLRVLVETSGEFGKGFADITTRQQIQLRWFTINNVPEIWQRLNGVGLITLQTGMDNIRNVVGCPVAGLTPNELFDASPVVHEFTQMFVGKKAYTNLPRKFNDRRNIQTTSASSARSSRGSTTSVLPCPLAGSQPSRCFRSLTWLRITARAKFG